MSKQVSIEFDKKQIMALGEDLKKSFNHIIQSESLIKEIADTIIKDIQFQTRRGKSLVTGDKLKPLSESWIKFRERFIEKGSPHPAASPKRSNLTLSGQLLDSMQYKNIGKGKIKFYFDGVHKSYKVPYLQYYERKIKGKKQIVNTGRSGIRTVGEEINNSDLAKYVEEQGRPFFGIRPQIEKRVVRLIIAQIRRNYKLITKLKNR